MTHTDIFLFYAPRKFGSTVYQWTAAARCQFSLQLLLVVALPIKSSTITTTTTPYSLRTATWRPSSAQSPTSRPVASASGLKTAMLQFEAWNYEVAVHDGPRQHVVEQGEPMRYICWRRYNIVLANPLFQLSKDELRNIRRRLNLPRRSSPHVDRCSSQPANVMMVLWMRMVEQGPWRWRDAIFLDRMSVPTANDDDDNGVMPSPVAGGRTCILLRMVALSSSMPWATVDSRYWCCNCKAHGRRRQ